MIFKLNINDEQLEDYCKKHFQEINANKKEEKLLGFAYFYARSRKLKDYQSRSFASELTCFLTNKIIDTDVSLIYNEAKLDSYLYDKYLKCNNLNKFIDYMIDFYKSSKSWKYERVGKYMQFKVTSQEKEMFYDLPANKHIDKFNLLLSHYDNDLPALELKRIGLPADTTFSINLATSQYEGLMSAAGDTKTDKFLNLLYYGYDKINKGEIVYE